MHISEGILSAPVLAAGAFLALGGVTIGLKKIKNQNIPQAAILSAMFFTASLIHIKIGPAATHLVLSGLMGLLLGWAAFPVIALGLLLQGLLFQFGGLSTLGLNTFNMAAPAVFLARLCRHGIKNQNKVISSFSALVAGGGAILLSAALVAFCLYLSGEQFTIAAYALIIGSLPVVLIEAIVCLLCVQFLKKVRPSLLSG
ncbi:MAG: cobalt transporter CbiM [Candidatus Adiutrix sp.]